MAVEKTVFSQPFGDKDNVPYVSTVFTLGNRNIQEILSCVMAFIQNIICYKGSPVSKQVLVEFFSAFNRRKLVGQTFWTVTHLMGCREMMSLRLGEFWTPKSDNLTN